MIFFPENLRLVSDTSGAFFSLTEHRRHPQHQSSQLPHFLTVIASL